MSLKFLTLFTLFIHTLSKISLLGGQSTLDNKTKLRYINAFEEILKITQEFNSDSCEEKSNAPSCTKYVVKSGDGAWNLSESWCKDGNGWKTHIFTDSNCTSNLTTTNIKIGQELYFGKGCTNPNSDSDSDSNSDNKEKDNNNSGSCTEYTIKSGDGLWNLSNDWCKDGKGWKNHIFTDSNCGSSITSSNIMVGQKIYFGKGCTNPNSDSDSNSDNKDKDNDNSDNCTEYTIKSGDGLWTLSNDWCKDGSGWKNHIFTDSNCATNITSSNITVGQKIYFGKGCKNPNSKPDTGSAGKNVFISYISAKDVYNTDSSNNSKRLLAQSSSVNDIGSYVSQKGLQGSMMWEISGDLPTSNPLSLKNAVLKHPGFNNKVSGYYWADWDMYLESHAISSPNKPIDDFQADFTTLSNAGRQVYVYYAFMETISKTDSEAGITENDLGTLYFFDPWSDISPSSCSDDNLTDTYVMRVKKNAAIKNTCENATKYDNFPKFSKLSNAVKFISVGGYSYDRTFEVMFADNGALVEKASDNFIKSAVDLIKKYNIDGIDLDYEDLHMTHDMSESYLALIKKMRQYFNDNGLQDKKILLTILSDPKYMKGVRGGQYGFKDLSAFEPYIDSLQLMTYDFHGGFDFGANGFNKTGFLSNLESSTDYAPNFSVDNSVQAALEVKIPASKVIVGVPAYGRSVSNIDDKVGKQGVKGLGQGVMEGKSIALLAGDMDNKGCETSSVSPCTGMFSYRYIIENLLKEGFEGKQGITPEIASAAYAEEWKQPTPPKTCTEYTIKSGDGLWTLSDAWCHDGNGWKTHIFTDSKCETNISTSSINVGEKIYFGTGCKSPN